MTIKETVLIDTLRAEPQVITLVLDALLTLSIQITRVDIIHTDEHYEPVRRALAQLRTVFLHERVSDKDLLFNTHLLAGKSGPLVDVVEVSDIDHAFQSLYTLIRQHEYAGCTIQLCIAGGRKTMALFAMSVAQILFDSTDHAWHLVSSPNLLKSGALHSADPAQVQLVAIPIAYTRPTERTKAQDFLQNVLSPAEREVAELPAREGLSNSALATRLHKSPKTIANQLSSVYAKLGSYFGLSDIPDRAGLLVLLGRYS